MPIETIVTAVLAVAVGSVVGVLFTYFWLQKSGTDRFEHARQEAARLLTEAETAQKEILLAAKEEAIRARTQAEAELNERRADLQRQERRLAQKEENLDRKTESLEQRERQLISKEQEIEQLRKQVEELRRQQRAEIERIAGLTAQAARKLLLADINKEIREDADRRVRQIEQQVREEAAVRSRKILATTMQRLSTEVVAETTVSVVPIPSEDMKGRIIGREGRNIRALEAATGVDVIIDDTPDVVTLSAFDPVRREIARVALSKLVLDGRIHPTRIEEMVEKAKQEVEASIKLAGEQAAIEAGVPGLHPEILRTLGRLKYRTSYGQNQLKHAVETAHLAAMVAKEIGADVNIARRGGLLHDIGKAMDHEVEGTHAFLGAELARRYNVHPAVVHCIEAHHEEVEPSTVESLITIIADSCSGSRPGARRESLEQYIRRLEALEAVANSFKGVERSFAIQAGREIRIIVKPEEISDLDAMRLARDISKKIEETLEYPGQIKVTVVRETRATEYAR